MEKVIKGTDVVIHAAAALPLWKKEDIFSTNVDGTKNVLQYSIEHKVKRVIYISSTAVYGVPEKHPIVETDPLV
ncbi:MAG: NAD-dependent epimerase/dehydratase family protein, partial [Candidatus Omnitrophota bacterium]